MQSYSQQMEHHDQLTLNRADKVIFLRFALFAGDRADFELEFNGSIMVVSIYTNNTPNQPVYGPADVGTIMARLHRAASPQLNDNARRAISRRTLQEILFAGRFAFRRVAPPSEQGHLAAINMLHAHMPKTRFKFRLKCFNDGTLGEIEYISNADTSAYPNTPFASYGANILDVYGLLRDESLPVYATTELQVAHLPPNTDTGRFIACVTVDNSLMFCEVDVYGGSKRLASELRRYSMAMSALRRSHGLYPYRSERVRIAAHHGYVVHSYYGRVVGSLRQWIPGRRLVDLDMASPEALQHKAKWRMQLVQTFTYLHSMKLTVDDFRSAAIIISDGGKDAWLAGFNGRESDPAMDFGTRTMGDENNQLECYLKYLQV